MIFIYPFPFPFHKEYYLTLMEEIMCGIYGYIGRNAPLKALEGITRLEYRGYDSAGLAYIDNDLNLSVIKKEGELKALKAEYEKINPKGKLSIAHTRWATHGRANTINAHPHQSQDGMWAIVHNGIIENYQELKMGKLVSETDTEVAVQLLQELYNGSVLETIKLVCDKIMGSFAFAILTAYQPDKIFVAKRNSPVVVGASKDFGVVCSDLNSIEEVDKAYLLENDNFAILEKGNVTIYNNKLNIIKPKPVEFSRSSQERDLGKYPHYMLKEIEEEPTAIIRTIKENGIEVFANALPNVKDFENILLIGCGTAYHAGLVGKKLFNDLGIKCEAELASEFRYESYVSRPNTLAIFISQSGETADTNKALLKCKEMGMATLAITNVKNSSIIFLADKCIYTYAGAEISVASTKAYICQLVILYLLSSYFQTKLTGKNEFSKCERQLCECSELMRSLNAKPIARAIAKRIHKSQSIYMLGRGLDYAIAEEASLKLKEVSYIHCEAYPAGELKHGTISLIDKNTFVFAFVTQSWIKDKALSNIQEVQSRGGKVILFTSSTITGKYEKMIVMPVVEEKFMPLVIAKYMQLIAYYTSVMLGNNPDKPRSLAKSVTVE